MNTFNQSMEKIFDVTPVVEEKKSLVPVEKPAEDNIELKQDLKDAYQQTKDHLQEFIEQGKEAMEDILQVAKAGLHPRAFEVYGTILKNMVDANKELLSVQKQMREMDGKNRNNGDTKIDKAIFVGSTAELSKFINQNK